MIIEYTDDFIREIKTVKDNITITRIIDLINDSFYQMYHHHHIVFMNVEVANFLLDWCGEGLNLSSKQLIKWICSKAQDLKAVKDKSLIVIQPTLKISNKETIDNKTTYKIMIDEIGEIKESVLMSENQDDAFFYLRVFDWLNNSNGFGVSFSNQPYYGSNVQSAIITTYQENKYILCISDSDRDFSSGKAGTTYKSARNGEKIIQRKTIQKPFHLYVLGVREKENLFPYGQYIKYGSVEKEANTLLRLLMAEKQSELIKFFDVKDGIKKKWRVKNKTYHLIYDEFLVDCRNNGVCKEDPQCDACSGMMCNSCDKKDEKYILGIGDKILADVSTKFFNQNKNYICNTSEQINDIFGNQLFLIDEWRHIYDYIFTFGCCVHESVQFIV